MYDGMTRVGVSRIDITPPMGIPLVGFAGRGASCPSGKRAWGVWRDEVA